MDGGCWVISSNPKKQTLCHAHQLAKKNTIVTLTPDNKALLPAKGCEGDWAKGVWGSGSGGRGRALKNNFTFSMAKRDDCLLRATQLDRLEIEI